MAKNSLVVTLSGDNRNLEQTLNNTRQSINSTVETTTKLEKIQKQFNKISESSAPLSKKIRDIKKQMELMAVSGVDATEEGKEMWQRLSEAAKQYDEMLKRIQNDTRKVGEESSDVKPISSESGNLDFKGIGKDILQKSGLGGVASSLGGIASMVNPVTVGITAVGATMIQAGKATAEFETHLNSLKALTGLTDGEMKAINDGAIEMSKNFKSSASEIVDAMKLIGSQAPELLKDSDALMKVTEAANVLSEAAEIGVEDAAKAITGTMNQMGASASEATEIINTFAAASQQGSADVAYLNKAFEKSGTAAASAGMDYVQLASAVEAVAPKFSSADVAGSQLASTLLKLSMSGKSEYMPSVVGMSKALENLAKAEMDDVTMKGLVGESNITMLKTLIQARDQFDSYSESLRGTNTAYEQMEINQKGLNGTITKLKSAWDAFLLTLGESGVMQGLTENLMLVINAINEIINVISDVIKSFEAFGESGVKPINLLKYQLDLLIGIIKAVGVIVEIVVRLIAKAFNSVIEVVKDVAQSINDKWQGVKKSLGDIAFIRTIINAFNKVLDAAANMCNQIKKYWNKLKEFLGMKVETNVEEKVTHTDSNVEENKPTNTNINTNSGGSKKDKKKGSKTEKIEVETPFEEGSIADLENQLKKLEEAKKKLLQIKANAEDLKAIEKEAKELKEKIEKEEIRIGLKPEIQDGSLNAIKKKIKEKEEEIQLALNSNISPESMRKMQSDLEQFRKEEEAKEIELGIKEETPTYSKKEEKFKRGSLQDIEQSTANGKNRFEELQKEYKLGLKGKDEVEAEIKEINEKFDSIGIKKIDYVIDDNGTLQTTQQQLNGIGDVVGNVGSAFGGLGSILQNFGDDAAVGKAALIANAIGQLAVSFAGAMKGTFTPWDWVAGAISGASVLASVVAQMSQFENGGIVGGSSYYGDKIFAKVNGGGGIRVNSGEMILNRNQQANLYHKLQNAETVGSYAGQSTLKGDVNFNISGSSLKGALKNYETKMSKIK